MLFLAALAVLIPVIIFLLIKLTPLPPADEMEYAREELSQAAKDRADTYSKKLYTEARIIL